MLGNVLTIDEISKSAKVHEATVREWIRNRGLRALRIGGSIRVKEQDFLDFIEAVEPEKPKPVHQ